MRDENKSVDFAKDTVVEKLPNWLRWLVLIPISLFLPFLFLVIWDLFSPEEIKTTFWYELFGDLFFGSGIVLVASFIAPKYQKRVASISVIGVLLVRLAIYLYPGTYNYAGLVGISHGIIATCFAVVAMKYIWKKHKEAYDDANYKIQVLPF